MQVVLDTRGPVELAEGPARSVTPVGNADGPTMGTNCWCFLTTDTMGWLKAEVGADGCRWTLGAESGTTARGHRCTQVRGLPREVTPLVLLVWLIRCVGLQ